MQWYGQSQRLTPLQHVFWKCLSFAQRQSGRPSEALRTAQKFMERCNAMKYADSQLCLPGAIAEALAKLDEERPSAALTLREWQRGSRAAEWRQPKLEAVATI
jgi:hypothetical protein